MKMIDGEALLARVKGRFLGDEEELARFISGCEVEAAIQRSIGARPSPVRLLADKLSHEAEDECMRPKRTAYNVMQSIVDRLGALADELGEPPLEGPK